MPDLSRGETDPNDLAGIAMALGSAAALGLAIAVARFAYMGETNGLTIAASRGCLAAVLLPLACVLTGRSLRIGMRNWLHCAGLGLLMSIMFYGNVASVQFIAVGLAALLFYTFPPIVAVIEACLQRKLPAASKLFALALAFGGLVLMLGTSFANVDLRGVALALSAGIATAWHSVWVMRKLRAVERLPAIAHMIFVAGLVLTAVSLWNDEFILPVNHVGWLGFVAVILLQAIAVPIYIVAISRIGALKSAILSNVQPVVSIVAAYVFFGELLSPLQLTGGACVLLGIWTMQRADAR